MNLKQILIITGLIILIIGGFYYTMSPYQNCIRDIDKRIEEVRNKLATETDVTKRDKLELENKDLISQRESECSERSDW
jgi:hypothetical protein|tara:strand:+ start:375 stop:611 length:237 start_codon:yes stop_codon:yes gene_type:complete